MKYHKYTNFITAEDCDELASWIVKNQNSKYFLDAYHPGAIRKTTRFSNDVVYPKTAYRVQENIDNVVKDLFKLDTVKRVQSFPNGMYASIGTPGDCCEEHVDPRYLANHYTYHFNVILSDYENADLFVDRHLVTLSKLDGILYPVSELLHYTTKLTNTNSRLFWCFGYCIPIKNAGL